MKPLLADPPPSLLKFTAQQISLLALHTFPSHGRLVLMRCSPEMGRPKYAMMQTLGVPPQIAKSCLCLPPFPSFTFGSSFVSEGMHRSRKKVPQCFAVLAILSVCVQVGANFLEARADIGLCKRRGNARLWPTVAIFFFARGGVYL